MIVFAHFAENLCKNLIEQDYFIVSDNKNSSLTEKTECLTLIRNQSPVLYAVNIINTFTLNKMDIDNISTMTVLQLEKILQDTYCSRLVVLNVLVFGENNQDIKAFIDEKELLRGKSVNIIWWGADISNTVLHFGKKQPTKLLNHTQLINNALSEEMAEGQGESIAQMENIHRKNTRIKQNSNDYNLVLILMATNIMLWVISNATNTTESFFQLFANDSFQVIKNFEVYRLLTSMFLHTTIYHLGFNMLSLFVFGSRLELYIGKKRFFDVYIFSGIIGAAASVFLTKGISVGASGAIYGIIGAFAVFGKSINRDVGGFNYFTLVLFMLMGAGIGAMTPGVDNFAHIGGFLGGIAIQGIFVHNDRLKKVDK